MDPYLLRALEMTPRLAERELRAADGVYDARPDPNRFSMKEVVAHLADWEPIMLTRIQVGVDTPGGAIQAYDEGQMAIDHDYASSNPIERIGAWKHSRAATIEYLGGLAEDDFAKTVVHPERGEMSVADIAHMLVSHDVYHLEQLATMSHDKTIDTW
ncbi:MAG: DinB family protein [Fimbriimonadales bacterium]